METPYNKELHSQEPWRLSRQSGSYLPTIVDCNNNPVAYEEAVLTIQDARRIVACVNFFQDFPQDDLTLLASAPLSLSEARCRVADIIERDMKLAAQIARKTG